MYAAKHIDDPQRLLLRAFSRSVAGHVVVLVLFIVAPLVRSLFEPELPEGSPFFVELASSLPPGPPPAPAAPDKAEQEQEVEDSIPVPVKKVDIPDPKKEAKKDEKKAEKPKIKVSTNLVKRTDVKTDQKKPQGKQLSEAEIRRMLAAGITGEGGGGGKGGLGGTGTGPMTEMDNYYAYVFKVLYEAWIQPSDLAGSQISAAVKLRVQRDGTIVSRDMIRPSGNAVMDASVMKAVRGVPRLRPLPSSYGGASKDIVIDFQLEAAL